MAIPATDVDPIQERAERLAEKVNQGYPEAWKPNAGETFVGVFQRLETGHTSYGQAWIAILTDPASGQERSIWLLHTALRNQFKRQAPAPGELVAVKYEGKTTSQSGMKYDNWTVRVDRGDTTPDWSKVAGDDEPATASRDDFQVGPEDDDIPF